MPSSHQWPCWWSHLQLWVSCSFCLSFLCLLGPTHKRDRERLRTNNSISDRTKKGRGDAQKGQSKNAPKDTNCLPFSFTNLFILFVLSICYCTCMHLELLQFLAIAKVAAVAVGSFFCDSGEDFFSKFPAAQQFMSNRISKLFQCSTMLSTTLVNLSARRFTWILEGIKQKVWQH